MLDGPLLVHHYKLYELISLELVTLYWKHTVMLNIFIVEQDFNFG